MDLGSYSDLSLAAARKLAKELRARVALGYDVAAEKQERKREAVAKIEAEKNALTAGLDFGQTSPSFRAKRSCKKSSYAAF
jgi:3-phosphoglycerate kinase